MQYIIDNHLFFKHTFSDTFNELSIEGNDLKLYREDGSFELYKLSELSINPNITIKIYGDLTNYNSNDFQTDICNVNGMEIYTKINDKFFTVIINNHNLTDKVEVVQDEIILTYNTIQNNDYNTLLNPYGIYIITDKMVNLARILLEDKSKYILGTVDINQTPPNSPNIDNPIPLKNTTNVSDIRYAFVKFLRAFFPYPVQNFKNKVALSEDEYKEQIKNKMFTIYFDFQSTTPSENNGRFQILSNGDSVRYTDTKVRLVITTPSIEVFDNLYTWLNLDYYQLIRTFKIDDFQRGSVNLDDNRSITFDPSQSSDPAGEQKQHSIELNMTVSGWIRNSPDVKTIEHVKITSNIGGKFEEVLPRPKRIINTDNIVK